MMLVEYIDAGNDKIIVSVNTGHAPDVEDVITFDTIKPSNPKRYRVHHAEHIIQVPDTAERGDLVKASCDKYKIYVLKETKQ